MSIAVNNISKVYGEQLALDDVSFRINQGEIVGFLGPNGAGKSTMMKILTGFLPPSSGTAEVCGLSIENDLIEVKRRVGYLPEQNPLYTDMYVREYLGFVAGVHSITKPKERIDEMIEMVGLTLERKKQIGSLSKGYRQRVGLASALIHNPEVLILDEPTTGLDPNQIIEIRSLIESLRKDRTVMLSTHIMQEVEAICDRVIIINHGKLVADDTSEHLTNDESKHYVRVEFDTAVASNTLKTIPGVTDVNRINDETWILGSRQEDDIRQDVFSFAVQNDLSVLTIQKEEQRLEDIFKRLTSS